MMISKSGFYSRTESLVVQGGKNNLKTYRVGFTASRKVGNAVVRNRCKRRLREAANKILQTMGVPGVDYVFIARKSAFDVSWSALFDDATHAVRFLNQRICRCKNF